MESLLLFAKRTAKIRNVTNDITSMAVYHLLDVMSIVTINANQS